MGFKFYVHVALYIKKTTKVAFIFVPSVGIEPTTVSLKGSCSTDWATKVFIFHLKYYTNIHFHLLVNWCNIFAMESRKNILILHDIRSAQNVGAIFRTADACSINKIICQDIPDATDRFGRKEPILQNLLLARKKILVGNFQKILLRL